MQEDRPSEGTSVEKKKIVRTPEQQQALNARMLRTREAKARKREQQRQSQSDNHDRQTESVASDSQKVFRDHHTSEASGHSEFVLDAVPQQLGRPSDLVSDDDSDSDNQMDVDPVLAEHGSENIPDALVESLRARQALAQARKNESVQAVPSDSVSKLPNGNTTSSGTFVERGLFGYIADSLPGPLTAIWHVGRVVTIFTAMYLLYQRKKQIDSETQPPAAAPKQHEGNADAPTSEHPQLDMSKLPLGRSTLSRRPPAGYSPNYGMLASPQKL